MKPSELGRALEALGPYLEDLVICGAWAWYLYRRCLGPVTWMPSDFTRDIDCIGHEGLAVRGETVFHRLTKGAAFVWVPRGEETPPAARFAWPNAARPEVEVEFVVPARGDGSRHVVEIQAGLTALPLRDLEILQDRPLQIVIDDRSPLAAEMAFRGSVRVPRIGCFVVQKALIHQRRNRDQQVKDLSYVFDLIDRENGLSDMVRHDVLSAEPRWRSEVARFTRLLEARITEPPFLVAMARQFAPERAPSTAYIGREIMAWLERLDAVRQEADPG